MDPDSPSVADAVRLIERERYVAVWVASALREHGTIRWAGAKLIFRCHDGRQYHHVPGDHHSPLVRLAAAIMQVAPDHVYAAVETITAHLAERWAHEDQR